MSDRIQEYSGEPCPVCGHRQWCGRRDDGLVLCKRPPTPPEVPGFTFKGMAEDNATGMYVEAGREYGNSQADHSRARPNPPAASRPSQNRVSPALLQKHYPGLVAQLTPERSEALADALDLPATAPDCMSTPALHKRPDGGAVYW